MGTKILNSSRRDKISECLPAPLKALNKDISEESEYLFGDNILEKIEDISKRNKTLYTNKPITRGDSKNWKGFPKSPANPRKGSTQNYNQHQEKPHYQNKTSKRGRYNKKPYH